MAYNMTPNGGSHVIGGVGGPGNVQIINGKSYQMYSPEWYEARRQDKVTSATNAGEAAGAYTKSALGGIPSLAGLLDNPPYGAGLPGSGDGSSGSGSGSLSASGSSGLGGFGTPGSVGGLDLPDQTAANNAIFARAKDAIGQQSRAALTALNDEVGAQGMSGGGAHVAGIRDLIEHGSGELGQVSRDLAIKNADMAADFAKTRYQGGITQRGQDIQHEEANAQLALAKQQADQNTLFRLLSLAMNGLGGAESAARAGLY